LTYPRDVINNRKTELNGFGVLSFPKNLGAHATLLIFKKYAYQSPGTRGLNRISDKTLTQEQLGSSALLLPLPKEIRDSYSIKINDFEQGMFGDAISQGAGVVAGGEFDINKVIQNVGLPAGKVMVAGVTGAAAALGARYLSSRSGTNKNILGAGFLGAALPGADDIATSIGAGAGAIINPKQALHFNGIEMKNHTFSWTMAPTAQSESETILNITNTVRRNALPSYTNIGPFKRAFLNYPSTVDIYFFGIQQEYFMFFKTCMINSVDINYTPQGMTVLRGGKPAIVEMSIGLKEMDIHTAEDYGGKSTNIGTFDVKRATDNAQ
jgi:hypothetical protein